MYYRNIPKYFFINIRIFIIKRILYFSGGIKFIGTIIANNYGIQIFINIYLFINIILIYYELKIFFQLNIYIFF